MKLKSKILFSLLGLSAVSTIVLVALDKDPFPVTFLGLFASFLLYALWPIPPKHKDFSYKDQQRAMRAFDRSDLIDPGKPYWAKDKKKSK